MIKFNQKIAILRHELDDIINYLEHTGKSYKKVKKIRNQLDNIDPFVRVNSAVAAESIINKNILLNSH